MNTKDHKKRVKYWNTVGHLRLTRNDGMTDSYVEHRIAHQEGRGKKFKGEHTWGWGWSIAGDIDIPGYQFYSCYTPEWTKTWEMGYAKRILGGETGKMFEKEIRNSPLPPFVIENLLYNLKNRKK
jgi:hypothetical protein